MPEVYESAARVAGSCFFRATLTVRTRRRGIVVAVNPWCRQNEYVLSSLAPRNTNRSPLRSLASMMTSRAALMSAVPRPVPRRLSSSASFAIR